MNVAINGFGRIGRNVFKAGLEKKELNFVGINDLTDTKTLAYLLKYDTAYGHFDGEVDYDEKHLIVDGKKIPVFAEKDPGMLPWKKLKVDVVLECTGFFVSTELAMPHIKAGAKRVILSAPAKDETPTFLIGVNADKYDGKALVVSNASCTTNCIGPVMEILSRHFGIKKSLMTTIHAYTAQQALQDAPQAKDMRRGRAATQNIVPTSTGAAGAIGKILPAIAGKFDGQSLRVPIIVGSLSDFTVLLEKKTTVEEINKVFTKESESKRYSGILAVSDEPLVSSDFIGSPYSAIVDLPLTQVMGGDFAKIMVWYDNEWGYSQRLADLTVLVGKKMK
ncbi:MAG: Glyceraldehyde-3-phosphate dehydrogenase [Parcubacteria group bacterium Gr01-1014_18]|nr:MAG: Glyceraldehyde-3-phosphate dehydrogenase [Parcubacteria group bacterium Greene0416_36]TSC81563.1 MAG: Glyceraldehyde-3-phosphate dehydrogenase [Parcubacteria group bacterium Gr01-1014_18]TSC99626.1 MAG: Glyceraldehyde-3-phosphate dehydrogenase [Parcubacteria group bacterium Greene1014_20]TSD07077.1 MAG: Glyceraldehyde-3-phosphate dehydrogenase [Parcubacteria group bacterium Greene0714_2]